MANNSEFRVQIVVTDNGGVKLAEKNIRNLGAAVSDAGRKHKAASRDADDFFDTQKKGIVGTANSTKSFSKLAETIGRGGSSGLVGAYATLAANIFAVTAAFNALRSASQVEQIFRGLEAAGTRVGLSLNTTAKALKEVSGAAISTEQAMRSTAQITSAGFNSKAVERLGRAARDTSFALGRNMTDSLDRLSRGVVKLEPELLDELGIMTKITESNVRYAQQLGKTESQLSNFEKRQGFMNAVLAEAELKFGGLSKAAGDSTAYDRLAASFSDLSNTIFNAINTIAKPIAGILAGSTATLAAVMLGFAASLKNQLVPGLAGAAARMSALATESKDLAKKKLVLIERSKEVARSAKAEEVANAAVYDNIGTRGPKAYLSLRDAIKAGTVETKDYDKALNSLNKSVDINQRYLEAYRRSGDPRANQKAQEIENTRAEILAVRELRRVREEANKFDVNSTNQVIAARNAAKIASREALAQTSAAASIGAASQLKLVDSYKQLVISVKAYSSAQALASGGALTSLSAIRTAAFAASVGVRAIGTAFLTFLPYLSLIIGAVGLLKTAWDSLKSDAVKELEKALEAFNETAAKANEYGKELERINTSQASAALRAAASLTIQANAVREIAERYEEYLKTRNAVDQDGFGKNLADYFTGGDKTADTVATFWGTLGKRSSLSYLTGIKRNSEILNIAESVTDYFGNGLTEANTKALQTLNTLNEAAPKDLEKWVKTNYGSWKDLNSAISKNPNLLERVAQAAEKSLNNVIGSTNELVTSLQENFKQLESDLSNFFRSAAISTPFDSVVKSITATNNAIIALNSTYKGSGDWKALLTGIDSNTASTLGKSTQEALKNFREQDAIAQRLLAKQSELNAKKQDLSKTEKVSLRAAERQLSTAESLKDQIQQDLMLTEKKFLRAQEVTRQTGAQLTLMQAQISASSTLYKAGAAGMRLKLADEAKVRDLQKSQLQVQIDVLKASVSLNESKQIALQSEIDTNRELLQQIDSVSKLNLLEQKRALNAKGVTDQHIQTFKNAGWDGRQASNVISGPVDQATRDAITQYLSDSKAIEDSQKKIADAEAQMRATQQASRDILASIKKLSTDIEAINKAALTPAERRVALQRAELELKKQLLTEYKSQVDALREINAIQRQNDSIVSGVTDNLDYQLKVIRSTAQEQRDALDESRKSKLLELQITKNEALAAKSRAGGDKDAQAAAQALIDTANEALYLAEESYRIDLKRINVNERNSILQKTYFDTTKEGIEWQRTSLEYLEKAASAQRDLVESSRALVESRTKLSYKKSGLEMSDSGNQALEIRAARQAYQLAVEEVGVKKGLIDLEFALLDAQKDQLMLELRARRSEIDPQDTVRLEQIDKTLARLENIDVSRIADVSKKALDLQIQTARSELESTITGAVRPAIFSGLISMVRGFAERRAEREKAVQALSTKIPQGQEEVQRGVLASDRKPIESPLIKSNEALIASLNNAATKIEEAIKSLAPTTEGGPALDTIKKAFDYAGTQGARASELKGVTRVGEHTAKSKHYSGQAFDVNIGYGNIEANDPKLKARMDKLAEYYRAQGYRVLWMVKGHYDHMHVEMTSAVGKASNALARDVEKTSKAAETAISKMNSEVAQAANDNTPDIVVSGKRIYDQMAAEKGPDIGKIKDYSALEDSLDFYSEYTSTILDNMQQLGPEGEAVGTVISGLGSIADAGLSALKVMDDSSANTKKRFASLASVVSAALSVAQSALAASAQAKEDAVQREIDAETKRDGKSAESVAKIKSLEKKKDDIARKQFNTNKKLMMAQAVIGTATGVTLALASGLPPYNIIMAGIIGAMGAAQLAIIAGTQYQSSSANTANTEMPSTLTIGKRGDTVDLARQNANLGGELGYLRGAQGLGSNASNYRLIGSAYGSEDLFRGYGNSGFIVGEKGPETLTRETPITVRPANDNSASGKSVSATLNIRALDARGVEEVLHSQRGNIISMLREAANASGETFMEDVDVNVYTSPRVNRL